MPPLAWNFFVLNIFKLFGFSINHHVFLVSGWYFFRTSYHPSCDKVSHPGSHCCYLHKTFISDAHEVCYNVCPVNASIYIVNYRCSVTKIIDDRVLADSKKREGVREAFSFPNWSFVVQSGYVTNLMYICLGYKILVGSMWLTPSMPI